MTDERRYSEDEVAAIFEAAAAPRATGQSGSTRDGLTLAELQSIGQEVGVPADRIADAASALDRRRDVVPAGRFLGMPLSVGRTVDLPRAPTDREWEILVADLRRTFGAQGRLGSAGSMREWMNGNLHAVIEPTGAGYRLRLGTRKGDAVALNQIGISLLAMALALLVVTFLMPQLAEEPFTPAFLGALGAAALGYNALRLPSWALRRDQQMQEIAARAQELLSAPAVDEPAR